MISAGSAQSANWPVQQWFDRMINWWWLILAKKGQDIFIAGNHISLTSSLSWFLLTVSSCYYYPPLRTCMTSILSWRRSCAPLFSWPALLALRMTKNSNWLSVIISVCEISFAITKLLSGRCPLAFCDFVLGERVSKIRYYSIYTKITQRQYASGVVWEMEKICCSGNY